MIWAMRAARDPLLLPGKDLFRSLLSGRYLDLALKPKTLTIGRANIVPFKFLRRLWLIISLITAMPVSSSPCIAPLKSKVGPGLFPVIFWTDKVSSVES